MNRNCQWSPKVIVAIIAQESALPQKSQENDVVCQ